MWRGNETTLGLIDHLSLLYAHALTICRFVAATPVAAGSRYFATFFAPQVIIFDEAGHARELTPLVNTAFFDAKARIVLGDPAQSNPWICNVDGPNSQKRLSVSLLERAVHKGIPTVDLMINRRTYGGLHTLPSKLFYGSRMKTDHDPEMLPGPVRNMRHYLDLLRGKRTAIPRLLADLLGSRWRSQEGATSPDNVAHRRWALARVHELLNAPWFMNIDSSAKGRILLLTTASASLKANQKETTHWKAEAKSRLDINHRHSSRHRGRLCHTRHREGKLVHG